MIVSKNFVKELATNQSVLFQFSEVPEEGLSLWMENLDEVSHISYSMEDSLDGVVWEKREFKTEDCANTASTFVLGAEDSHSMRIVKIHPFFRFIAQAPASGTMALFNVISQHEISLTETTNF